MERSTDGTPFKKQRHIDRLRKAYDRGELFIPPNEENHHKWWRCEARLLLGDYTDWSGWEYRHPWAATLWHWRDTKPYPMPPWHGQHTDCLYVIGEQGLGDEVFFAQCLADARRYCNRLVFECQPRLVSLMARSFPDVEVVTSLMNDQNQRLKRDLPPDVTAWFALADLPRYLRNDLSKFPGTPYLVPDIEQVRRFSDYRGEFGISWRGNQGVVKEIMALNGLSLQYDLAWDEEVRTVPGLDVRDDLEGLCGLLKNLDYVVCTSTSVAHFAAAMGIETHVILAPEKTGLTGNIFPFRWQCGGKGRTPWYGSARSYRNWNEFTHHWPRAKPAR